MRILITGAASPLGQVVTRMLTERGHRVVGLARRFDGLKRLEVLGAEPILGDVRRPEQVAKAVSGCAVVIHMAGFFDFWEPVRGTYDAVNVDATRNVVAAARHGGTGRLVLCSSAITVGSPGIAGDGARTTALAISKMEAEQLALRARRPGFEVVVVNPALVVAPDDAGWVGRLFTRAASGRRPLVSNAPMSWVWIEDAALGIVRAVEVGADGARYVLSGDTMSSRYVLGEMTERIGAPPPRELSSRLTMAEAALHTALAQPLRRRPGLALDEARFLTTGFMADGSFARHELGIEYTSSARYIPIIARQYGIAVRRNAVARA